MMYIIWFLLVIPNILMSFLAFPLAPFIVLLGAPKWCSWFLTPDNTIDGDEGHWERWPDNGTRWRIYCRRVAWLWRNRAYGFSWDTCGRKCYGETVFKGERYVSDRAKIYGICRAYNGKTWECYSYTNHGFFDLRVRLGWKIPQNELTWEGKKMYVCSITFRLPNKKE